MKFIIILFCSQSSVNCNSYGGLKWKVDISCFTETEITTQIQFKVTPVVLRSALRFVGALSVSGIWETHFDVLCSREFFGQVKTIVSL